MLIQEKADLAKLDITDTELAFDFETAGLHHKELSIEGLALAGDVTKPLYIPFDNTNISINDLYSFSKDLFSRDILFIGHNLIFDLKIVKYFFDVWPEKYFDTMTAAWYIDENKPKDLKTLATELLGIEMVQYKDVAKNRGEAEGYKEFVEYAKRDAYTTYELYKLFKPQLEKIKKLYVFQELEMPFIEVIVNMTLAGIDVDKSHLQRMAEILEVEVEGLQQQIYTKFGEEFNINSPQQLAEKLYGIKVSRKNKQITLERIDDTKPMPTMYTKKGAPSTSEKALRKIGTDEAKMIIHFKEMEKQLSTYALGYQKFIIEGKIWPNFFPSGTVTGRLSSSSPNMQNLPAERENTPIELSAREAFYVPDGYDMIVADESQLELRVLAHFSKDPTLIAAFKAGGDIHTKTASMILGKPPEEIGSDERRFSKTLNFAIIYGMGTQTLSEVLGVPMGKTKELLEGYFSTYAGVKTFISEVETYVYKHGYVKTLLKRYRRLPNVYSNDHGLKNGALRQAVNSVIQGSASDILKAAMVKIHNAFKEEELDAKMLLQIHDELVFRVKEKDTPRALEIVKHYMEKPFKVELAVPLLVEPKVCRTWREGK